jgi:hypothetical protein
MSFTQLIFMEWLRAQENVNDELVDAILNYESEGDSEFGCVHSAEEIEQGLCRTVKPHDIRALQIIAVQAGWPKEWKFSRLT